MSRQDIEPLPHAFPHTHSYLLSNLDVEPLLMHRPAAVVLLDGATYHDLAALYKVWNIVWGKEGACSLLG